MTAERDRLLAQLRVAREQGILDEDGYRTAVEALVASDQGHGDGVETGEAVLPHPEAAAAGKANLVLEEQEVSAQGGARAADEESLGHGGNAGNGVATNEGATVGVGEASVPMTAVDRATALGRYLQHITSRNRYLQLRGIRSGGRPVRIELDRIYVRLRATEQRLVEDEEQWLDGQAEPALGEPRELRQEHRSRVETVTISVEQALAAHRRLVVLGDPGSGKTTLLRHLILPYARDLAEGTASVQEKLGQAEPRRLPVLLALRDIGTFLAAAADESTQDHVLLLDFLYRSLANEQIQLPPDFFRAWFEQGDAVVMLDGLDEVGDSALRRRVARLVEDFVRAYPECRYLLTSRKVGYTGDARLGESFTTTMVRDFTLEDVQQFLTNWHRLVAVGQMGPGDAAAAYASEQTRQLVQAIEGNERIRELAINPLMLTVIAMVHRDRVKLPDRRAELYAEAVDVLLGKWEEAKGVQEQAILPGKPFDIGDKRLMLQAIALHMQERALKEIQVADLRRLLGDLFTDILGDGYAVGPAVERFIAVIRERTGLLVARGDDLYAFSHLTFQAYMAALAVAARDDYLEYTLGRVSDPWWREVILLEAGFLSTQGKERTTRLIRTIAGQRPDDDPYHNLVLTAACLRDVGASRVQGALEQEVLARLRKEVEAPPPFLARWIKSLGVKRWIRHRAQAMEALVRTGAGFWSQPFGEPEWVTIPAGEFWLGSERWFPDERPTHELWLPAFRISRAPITNAQYYLFTKAVGHKAPAHWEEGRPPKGLESHPVVHVSWRDALAYCAWLSEVTGHRSVTLASEAEWEKAARGKQDQREYPWGDNFETTRCNSWELGFRETTPVGIFPDGVSPYGCLEMSGNVWEWTRSLWGDYPYPEDEEARRQREDLQAQGRRVLRGGAFYGVAVFVRCATRYCYAPDFRNYCLGFRVVY